ncbi:hypothetical protein D3C79_994080 [compost metagenome]
MGERAKTAALGGQAEVTVGLGADEVVDGDRHRRRLQRIAMRYRQVGAVQGDSRHQCFQFIHCCCPYDCNDRGALAAVLTPLRA